MRGNISKGSRRREKAFAPKLPNLLSELCRSPVFPSDKRKGKATSPIRIGLLRIQVWDVGGKREGVAIYLVTYMYLSTLHVQP